MQLVLISGLSGSGKSIALAVLEDAGYYCVDNLPANLLPQLVAHLRDAGYERVGVAVDVRSGAGLRDLPATVATLRTLVEDVRFLFLEARNTTLIARFSETRRRHPLADEGTTVLEAIEHERELLEHVGELGQRIDTSDLRTNTLRTWIRDAIDAQPSTGLTLMFESFGFKHGIPLDADLVFDVRCLPNPYYDLDLRPLTGLDQPVADFLCSHEEVGEMVEDIAAFIARWLPAYMRDARAYLTVAIGCTGGQHRSVFIAESLAARFRGEVHVLLRHRALRNL
ncbi:RNase adapter RapZ [Niveibacterium sp. SC-1]|uniref:RNase adapter RapZ n=1 Tax=Niveibacterium sp. SC-1 TaxID=3135646 RepID=UPI00311EE693